MMSRPRAVAAATTARCATPAPFSPVGDTMIFPCRVAVKCSQVRLNGEAAAFRESRRIVPYSEIGRLRRGLRAQGWMWWWAVGATRRVALGRCPPFGKGGKGDSPPACCTGRLPRPPAAGSQRREDSVRWNKRGATAVYMRQKSLTGCGRERRLSFDKARRDD